jgi:FtsH-binding integral membrane protein
MRGRALIAGGWSFIIMGLFVLSPALWLIFDQVIQQVLGAPLIGIVIGGGGIIVPLILTAFGTATIVGGSWMITNGNRMRREPVKPRGSLKPGEPVKPADKTTIGGPT